jgi:YD repeat-containing protein
LYKLKKRKTYVCINEPIESSYSKFIGVETWKALGSNYTKVYYGSSQTELNGMMYLEDLVENQKNLNTTSFNNYLWYNKKRGLIVTDKAYIEIGTTKYDIKNILVGVITETDNTLSLTYNDYTPSNCFRRDYQISQTNGEEQIVYTSLDTNFLTIDKKMVKVDGKDVETKYTYDSYGKLLSEEVYSNSKLSLGKMKKTYTYQNNNLTKETVIINGVESNTSYESVLFTNFIICSTPDIPRYSLISISAYSITLLL